MTGSARQELGRASGAVGGDLWGANCDAALPTQLDSAADVICHGEVFKKERIEVRPWHADRLGIEGGDVVQRESDPLGLLLKLRGLNLDTNFGFKAFPTHLTLRGGLYSDLLYSPKWRKIFLALRRLKWN
jgi:hypothetical protein